MEDINNYIFDFKKEAEALLSELGTRGKNTILMKVHADGEEVTFSDITGATKTIDNYLLTAKMWAQSYYGGDDYNSSIHGSFHSSSDHIKIIYIRENDRFFDILGKQDKELMAFFTLLHERAHGFTDDGPKVDDNHPYRECAADAYAAIRMFQRFGPAAAGFLSRLSYYRSFNAIVTTDHLTTTVLDKIIADSAHTNFKKLTEEQTTEWAMAYAKTWTPMPEMLEKVREFLKEKENIFSPAKIYNEVLPVEKNPDDLVAYFGAKMLDPLSREGMVINGQEVVYDAEQRDKITKATSRRFGGKSLETIFNYLARRGTKSAQKTIKVTLPSGGPWNIPL